MTKGRPPAHPFDRLKRLKREGKGIAIHPLDLGILSESCDYRKRVPFLLNPSIRGVPLIQDATLPRGKTEERPL